MKLLTLLNLFLYTAYSYNITSSCYSCLSSTAPSNKYCISYDDATTGYCCELGNANDSCSKYTRYVCSDLVQSKSMKLYLCPNTATKCYATSLTE